MLSRGEGGWSVVLLTGYGVIATGEIYKLRILFVLFELGPRGRNPFFFNRPEIDWILGDVVVVVARILREKKIVVIDMADRLDVLQIRATRLFRLQVLCCICYNRSRLYYREFTQLH